MRLGWRSIGRKRWTMWQPTLTSSTQVSSCLVLTADSLSPPAILGLYEWFISTTAKLQGSPAARLAHLRSIKVCHAHSAVKRLVNENRLPHLLLYGPPGTGKTSTILAVARQIYGPAFNNMTLGLNASDERGIQVVREQVQDFASTRTIFRCAGVLSSCPGASLMQPG
jgi:ATPase family associated with various cellular activities (AAA)